MSDTLKRAATEYIEALDWSRELYIQTARNAPSEQDVRQRKAMRLEVAERDLRRALEDT